MAEHGFKIGVGWGLAAPANIEDILSTDATAPTVLDDQFVAPHGPIRHVAIDGTITRSGKRNVTWIWDTMTQTDFNTLIDTIFVDGSSSQHVTIWTLTVRGDYMGYNCIAEYPYPGQHYRHAVGGSIENLRLDFWDLREVRLSYNRSYNSSFG